MRGYHGSEMETCPFMIFFVCYAAVAAASLWNTMDANELTLCLICKWK